MRKMQAQNLTPTLGSVLSEYTKLSVEDYQRTYQWNDENINDLFDDLKDSASSQENHFFGTLILQQADSGLKHAFIVDGQQRITTVFILVSALRDEIIKLDVKSLPAQDRHSREINVLDKALDILHPGDKKNVFRFESNKFLRELCRDSVMAEPSETRPEIKLRDKPITKPFRDGVRKIRQLVESDIEKFDSPEAKLARIYQLLVTLLDRFQVLSVPTSNIHDSLDIFLTLNNRGLPLGSSDLVRGEIMKNRGTGLADDEMLKLHSEIFDQWKTIAENTGDPETFLRHMLVATGDSKVTKKKVVREVRNRISSDDPTEKSRLSETFWEEMIAASSIYAQIVNPLESSERGYRMMLLEKLSKSHRIALLGILLADFSDGDLDLLVRHIFVLSFRWAMAEGNAQQLEDFYQNICRNIRRGDSASSVLEQIREKNSEIKFDAFQFFDSEVDSGYETKVLLHAINRYVTSGSVAIPLNDKLHLEHIAPQSMTSEWAKALFSGVETDENKYQDLISTAGNLTLLDEKLNMQAGRKLFEEKASLKYKNSVLAGVTGDLTSYAHWNEELIRDRTKWMSEMFEIIWSLDRPLEEVVRFSTWQSGA